eukprot:3467808-Prymnesium_polylepis.1
MSTQLSLPQVRNRTVYFTRSVQVQHTSPSPPGPTRLTVSLARRACTQGGKARSPGRLRHHRVKYVRTAAPVGNPQDE